MAQKNYTTPQGTAIWPKISKPETKFDAEGVYETQLQLGAEDGAIFLSKMEKHLDEWHDSEQKRVGKNIQKYALPHKKDMTQDGEETGDHLFKFKLKAMAGKPGNKWEQKPKIFDSAGTPIKSEDISIGSGSTIRIGFSIHKWFSPSLGCGLSLQLKSVVVDELVEFGGDSFDSFGFEKVDKGFVHQATEQTPVKEMSDEGNSDF